MNRDTSPNLTTAVAVIALISAFLFVQHDDTRARQEDYQREAAEQDRAAISSREWAGRRVCGPKAEPQWLDDQTLVCLRVVDEAYVAGRTL